MNKKYPSYLNFSYLNLWSWYFLLSLILPLVAILFGNQAENSGVVFLLSYLAPFLFASFLFFPFSVAYLVAFIITILLLAVSEKFISKFQVNSLTKVFINLVILSLLALLNFAVVMPLLQPFSPFASCCF